ncbi:hypothetical protein BGW42_007187 [Actinomortierella wolfii]|nr:hypothetical protein BGW42_007187 [Actinomortierella wolfii]
MYSSADPLRSFIPSRPSTPQSRPASQLSFQQASQPLSQPVAASASEDHEKLNKLQEELAAIKAQLATLVSAQQEDSRRLSWPMAASSLSSPIPPPPPPPPPPSSGPNAAKKWLIPNSEVAQSMQNVLKELSSSQHKLRKTNSPYLARIRDEAASTSSSSKQADSNSKDQSNQKAATTTTTSKAPGTDSKNATVQPTVERKSSTASQHQPRTIPSSASAPPVLRNQAGVARTTNNSPKPSFQLWTRRTTTPTLPNLEKAAQGSTEENTQLESNEKRNVSRHQTTVLTPELTPPSRFLTETTLMDESEPMDLSVENPPSSSVSSASTSSITDTKREKTTRTSGDPFLWRNDSTRNSVATTSKPDRRDSLKPVVSAATQPMLTSSKVSLTSRFSADRNSLRKMSSVPESVSTPAPALSSKSATASSSSSPSVSSSLSSTGGRPTLLQTGFKRPRPARSGSSSSSSSVSTLQRAMTDPTLLSSSDLHLHDAKRLALRNKPPPILSGGDDGRQNNREGSVVATDPQRKQVTFASTASTTTSSHTDEVSKKHQRERNWFRELDHDSWRVAH